MKKTVILLSLVLITSLAFAQKSKVTSALSLKESGKISEALENINVAIDPNNEKAEKSIPWPKTWEVRGEIYQAIYKSDDANVKSLAEDPLTTALESYKKAIELDEGGKFSNNLKIKLTFLMEDLSSQAVNAWNNENYALALKSFEQRLEINEIPVIKADNPNMVDSAIIFNAALAANASENYKKAIQYFSEATNVGYNKGRAYLYLSATYKMTKDTASA
ncbi:MAG: hypothetical protein JXR31_05180, partial [Prolixibacteraceae bacterium]|nr:hypothetical protein [Prolixibacteraceae bacterium]